ncbi:DUF3540 domain-containing protein [Francisellaceae bacterium]|nr:DUF3540 domain-containing protein [Francisellaceae bacterium]
MSSQISSFNQYRSTEQTSSALVTNVDGKKYQIKIKDNHFQAKKAFSCLIQPMEQDIVQVVFMENEIYILSILERDSDTEVDLVLPDQTNITSAGNINIEARGISNKALSYNLITNQADITSKSMNMITEDLYQYSEFSQIKTQQLLKEVSQFEQSVTQELRMIVNDHWRVDSQSIHMLSEEDTTIDARTISIG